MYTSQQTYKKLMQQKLQEVFSLEPNDLGFEKITHLYKKTTGRLKVNPFVYILPLSVFIAVSMWGIFGHLVVKMVSVLQYGF
jgi:hypothetical protein